MANDSKKSGDAVTSEDKYILACCYADGEGVEQDMQQAFIWYEAAAKQGNADAQFELACCYDDGKGVEANKKQAYELYRQAAEQGNVDAQYNLGCCYQNGEGVNKNLEMATQWYTRVLELQENDADAKNALEEIAKEAEAKKEAEAENSTGGCLRTKALVKGVALTSGVIGAGALGFGLWAVITQASIGQLSLGLGLGLGLTVLSAVVWPVAAAAGIVVALYLLDKYGCLDGIKQSLAGIKQKLFCCAATQADSNELSESAQATGRSSL